MYVFVLTKSPNEKQSCLVAAQLQVWYYSASHYGAGGWERRLASTDTKLKLGIDLARLRLSMIGCRDAIHGMVHVLERHHQIPAHNSATKNPPPVEVLDKIHKSRVMAVDCKAFARLFDKLMSNEIGAEKPARRCLILVFRGGSLSKIEFRHFARPPSSCSRSKNLASRVLLLKGLSTDGRPDSSDRPGKQHTTMAQWLTIVPRVGQERATVGQRYQSGTAHQIRAWLV